MFLYKKKSVYFEGAAPLNEHMADKKYFIGLALSQQYHNRTLRSLFISLLFPPSYRIAAFQVVDEKE